MSKPTTDSRSKVATDIPMMESTTDHGEWEKWRALTVEAYARFHEKLLANCLLFPDLVDYAPVERAEATSGTFAWWWGAAGEIRETINSINAWGVRLHDWDAWNLVVDSYDADGDKWEVLNQFVEPVAFFCMLQPSSVADRLMVASEALLHQTNRRIFPDEPDRLDQDDLKPGMTVRRSNRRKQLKRLGKHWSKFGAFQDALGAMDGPEYQKVTRNFRDLSTHSFAPRLMIGHINRAIRSIVPQKEMVAQPNGTFLPVDHPTKKVVSYAMHVVEPLPLDATRSANLAEHEKALTTMNAFAALLDELCDRMDALPKHEPHAN